MNPEQAAIHVDTCTLGSDGALNDAAQTGSDVFVDDIRADYVIYVFRGDSGVLDGFACSLGSQIFEFFI